MKELEGYKSEFGDCNVSHTHKGYESLGYWIRNMRQAKKGKGTMKLTKDMIDRLNAIGFEWNLEKSFNDRMKELKEYKSEFGNCKVGTTKKGYESLGNWVAGLRRTRKGSKVMKLTKDMIVSLNAIGFFWGKGQSAEFTDAEKKKFDITS